MTAEQKKLTPTPPIEAPVMPANGKTQSDLDRVNAIRDAISALSSEGRALLGDVAGMSVPVEMDGVDLKVRKFGYRCKACGEVGLEFLGDKMPPMGIPFDRLLFVQDKGKYGEDKGWRRNQRKTYPRCMHCNQEMAKEIDGSIRASRLIEDIEQYRSAVKAQTQATAWNYRKPNYRRDSAGMAPR